jgi:rhodanese-related sulfurtransferase
MKLRVLVFLFLFAFTAASCSAQTGEVKFTQANNAEFAQKMKGEKVVVLDVRTPGEYASGHLEGAQMIDVTQPDFEKKIQTLDKNATYLVYCRSGARSSTACSIMTKNGFKKVVNLTNGISGWDGKVVK